jgi:hypothetical protein
VNGDQDHDDRRQLARQIEHAEVLLRDAVACRLPALVARRRVVLRRLRRRLEVLSKENRES